MGQMQSLTYWMQRISRGDYGLLYNWPVVAGTIPPEVQIYTGYGQLYNFYTVDTGLLAPDGWHVLSNLEWEELMLTIDPDGTPTVNDAGMKLKATKTWEFPDGGIDSYGFRALSSGSRDYDGAFVGMGNVCHWYTADAVNGNGVFVFIFSGVAEYCNTLYTGIEGTSNVIGHSVRCVKDSTTLSIGQTSTVTDIDGNTYPTVCMPDSKEWMASSLKVTKLNDSTVIPEVTDNSAWAALTTPGRCWYNNTPN
jgi:uncharacterized protein (TIGR02145 family)